MRIGSLYQLLEAPEAADSLVLLYGHKTLFYKQLTASMDGLYA